MTISSTGRGNRASLDEGASDIVRFGGKNEPARARDPDHLGDSGVGIGHMDQDRLASDKVKACVGERHPFGVGDLIGDAVGEPAGRGTCDSLFDPTGITIHALHARGGR